MKELTAQELYAQLYDVSVPDWPGEVDFYRELLADAPETAQGVLELACGTGRIALRLAREGIDVTGLDLAPELLEVARAKSANIPNVHWVLGDMSTFDLGRQFGIILIPGHSFQALNTPDDQATCLTQIKHHLVYNGLLILHLDHQDFGWLAGRIDKKETRREPGPLLTHPVTGRKFRRFQAWTFDPDTQTATVYLSWEELNETGEVIHSWALDPMSMHCAFRFEMEHLLRRVGFSIEALYGDFYKTELSNDSRQMIWVARNRAA